ncbi:MAG: P-loop NTPase [Ktedonobacteraceae bacterium]|nr:P-loop NTPase [Chloroflexota bacterium]
MTLEQFWIILVKRWPLIIICFLVVGAGTYAGSRLVTPLYQSTTLVLVALQGQNQADDITVSAQMAQTESQLVVSSQVLQVVASHYKGLSADQLTREVTASARLNTQLFEVDVQDPDPARAAALANDVATTLISQQLALSQQNYGQAIQQVQDDLKNTQQQIGSVTTQLGQLQAKLNNILAARQAADLQAAKFNQAAPRQDPQLIDQEATLQAQINVLQTQLNNLQQHNMERQTVLAQQQLMEAQNSNFLRVVQTAQAGHAPVSPQILLNTAAGLLFGLLLGMLLAFLLEQVDTRVRTSEAVTQVLDWPVLAVVWQQNPRKEAPLNPPNQSANAAAYGILRTNIGFSALDKPLRSLVVTSALPHEGKSVVAANLAICMARAGKSVLLIDADLHHPSQHTLFKMSPEKMGLSNAVLALSHADLNKPWTPSGSQFHNQRLQPQNSVTNDGLSLDPYVHASGILNLWIMPTGPLPPNPSEFLDSKAMQRFLAVIAKCGVEVIVFDTPPLLGLPDARILASKVDGTFAVVDMTRATRGKLKQLKGVLAHPGVNVLGCVANKYHHSRSDPNYSYNYQTSGQQQDNEEWSRERQFTTLPDPVRSPVSSSSFERGKKAR